MCGLAEASLAFKVISGVASFVSQRNQAKNEAKAARQEAEYRAAIQRENVKRAEYLALDAIERGKEEERVERLRGRLLLGQMRAVLAGAGQEVDSGSAGQLTFDQAEVNELNARTVRNNAAREADEYRIRAGQFENEASLLSLQGANRARSIRNSAPGIGSLIGTASSVASKWYQFREAGAFS